jgi:hypothetical protein
MSHFLRIANLQMINVMNENIFICVLSVFCLILVFFLFLEKRNSKGIIHAVIFSLYTLPLYYLMFFRGAGGAAFTWWFYLLVITVVHIISLIITIFQICKKIKNIDSESKDLRMKSKQQIFFLTKSDIIKMMSIVERKIPIDYVLMGAFKDEVIRRENAISKFTELGRTIYSNWISLDNRYMIQPINNEVNCRIVKQRDGSYHYIIDLSSNPKGVELSTGGVYEKAEKVLIAGRVAVFTDSSREAMQIYKEILKAMNECFTKRNYVFVSEDALDLLQKGWRLTYSYNAPCEYDFKLA